MTFKVLISLVFIAEAFASHHPSSNVTSLTASNFYNLVTNENIWVVHFYSSNIKKDENFAKEFALSADILKGLIKFGAIDIEDDRELAKHFTVDINLLPVVKVYGLLSSGKPKEYRGEKTAKNLTESILKHISKRVKQRLGRRSTENHAQEVNDNNFDEIITNSKEPWLVLFYAPWCIHCKEFQPMWNLLASNLKEKVKCAAIDATINTAKAGEYQITKYPTLKFFPFEGKSSQYASEYTQARTIDSITNWVLEKLPGPDIVQITNEEVFYKHCMKQSLCVVTALPPIFDCRANCREKYLGILQQLGEEHKRQRWGWVWTAAGAQNDLEKVLDIGGSGYPSLVVLNPIKMKYSVFKGAFTKSRMDEFLSDLTKVNAIDVDRGVEWKIASVKNWDGRDSVYEVLDGWDLHNVEFSKKDEL